MSARPLTRDQFATLFFETIDDESKDLSDAEKLEFCKALSEHFWAAENYRPLVREKAR